MITCGIDRKAAQRLYDAYWKLNWAIKVIASQQRIKHVGKQMWLYNPVSGFWYSLRYEKDIFSTLVQGTGSYVFDRWVEYILQEREQLTATFHDEFILHIKEGSEEKCTDLINRSMRKLNDELKLNKELGCGIQYGHRYSSIH